MLGTPNSALSTPGYLVLLLAEYFACPRALTKTWVFGRCKNGTSTFFGTRSSKGSETPYVRNSDSVLWLQMVWLRTDGCATKRHKIVPGSQIHSDMALFYSMVTPAKILHYTDLDPGNYLPRARAPNWGCGLVQKNGHVCDMVES